MSLLKYTLLHTLLIVTLYGTSDELMQMQKDLKQLQKELQTLKKDDLNISLPGQYRINFYSVDNDTASQDQQTAARMRIRQSIDIKFTPKLSSRVRFQLNHTNDSITDATDTKGNGVLIRHAFIQYHPSHSHKLKVGLVPVIEYQDDLLYSKSWGYNPFALEGFSSFNDLKLHYFAANLSEGSESNLTDDQIHYQADLIFSGKTVDLTLSTSLLDMANGTQRGSHFNAAIKASYKGKKKLTLHASALYSKTDESLLGVAAEGSAFRLECTKSYNKIDLGLLATHASGNSQGSGFLVPMSFTGTNSYWGYTGVVTVMAQTDTGFAGDSIHVSNNGYGLSAVQAKLEYKSSKKHQIYFAAGWFGNSQAAGRSSTVASELFVMNKYQFNPYLSLHLGASYAKLFDSLSGYGQGVIGGSSGFNQALGETREKIAAFGRVQLEF